MIIPWKVDVPQDRLPFANWLMIAAIVVVFVLQIVSVRYVAQTPVEQIAEEQTTGAEEEPTAVEEQKTGRRVRRTREDQIDEGPIGRFVLNGWKLKGLLGHMWLHGGFPHLIGNLLFLWIFGNAVCAKIGNLYYFPIYLLAGVFAGVAHLFFQGGAMIGASGAIYGIVGMYLIFFPENSITCYLLLFVPVEFNVRSIWVILFWVVFDIWGAAEGGGHAAYFAHLGGFAVGIGVAFALLKTGRVKMERYEKSLLQLVEQWRHPGKEQGGFDPRYQRLQKEMEEAESEERERQEVSEGAADLLQEEFIRFSCSCGKRVKVSAEYAGKTGCCPRCKKQLKIPSEPSG